MLFDGMGPDPTGSSAPENVNVELTDLVVSYVDDARVNLRDAMKMADRCGDRIAHVAIAEEMERVSALTANLIGRWSA